MLSRFFVNRPIFAIVIAIAISLVGLMAIFNLPVSQYPRIAPPKVTIMANYPGASAETISRTVTQIIEQQMTGLDGLLYMSSSSDSTGRAQIVLTFDADTNPDIAQVQVQNHLSVAESTLPEVVQQLGVTVEKSAASFLMVVGFIDHNKRMTSADIGDYLVNSVKEPLGRVAGVGQVTVFGASYAMRVWMDPNLLMKYNLQPGDVIAAIKAQNVQLAAGSIGGLPSDGKRLITLNVKSTGLLETTEDFGNIALKTNTDGSVVRVRDIGYTELGSQSYNFQGNFNGQAASGMAIELASGANALETAKAVKDRVASLEPYFPDGLEVVYPFETTPFVTAAMHEVIKTLIEAIILVIVVMYLFLQNWRATIIPTVTVPVVLLGTFGVLAALGYSINMLTMFALVLAIGLLVDDAIVVVENVERVMATDKTDAKTATIKSMQEITGALVGIAMVLSAVFIPMAFFGGSTGIIYRQFSVTIVSAMVLSVIVALILTPALCALMLKPYGEDGKKEAGGFFGWFNRSFAALTHGVTFTVSGMVKRIARLMLIYLVLCGAVVFGFMHLPKAFMPAEDQGSLLMMIQLPSGASGERTDAVLQKFENLVMKNEMKDGHNDVDSIMTVRGFSFAGTGPNTAMGFIKLKDWDARKTEDQTIDSIMMRNLGILFSPLFKGSSGFVFSLPAVPELGVADGFDFYLQDRSNQGHEKLTQVMDQFLQMANKDPRLTNVRYNGMADTPELKLSIDYAKARAMGVSDSDINTTITAALGSSYVNDFMDRGRVKQVYVQGVPSGRGDISDIDKWHVRNASGEMVSFATFATVTWDYGALRLERFNGLDAVNIQGTPAPGVSSGEAMQAVLDLVGQLPPGYSVEWNGVSYQEAIASSNAAPLYAISVLVVFLALAALYESWSIPIAVILVVPLGVLGALGLTWLVGKNNDVYFQVGLLTTVGLVAKNAILIVEFASDLFHSGMDALAAVVKAVQLRLRPIMMTSLAFGLGVLPLSLASGAGAGAQSAIGVAVLGGMLTGTFLCIFFVPVFYALIMKLFGRRKNAAAPAKNTQTNEVNHA